MVDIPREVIADVPEFGAGVDTEFLVGMGKVADEVVMLLDIDRVLSGKDVALVADLAGDEDADKTGATIGESADETTEGVE